MHCDRSIFTRWTVGGEWWKVRDSYNLGGWRIGQPLTSSNFYVIYSQGHLILQFVSFMYYYLILNSLAFSTPLHRTSDVTSLPSLPKIIEQQFTFMKILWPSTITLRFSTIDDTSNLRLNQTQQSSLLTPEDALGYLSQWTKNHQNNCRLETGKGKQQAPIRVHKMTQFRWSKLLLGRVYRYLTRITKKEPSIEQNNCCDHQSVHQIEWSRNRSLLLCCVNVTYEVVRTRRLTRFSSSIERYQTVPT